MGLDESNFTRGMLNAQGSAQIFGSTITTLVNNPLLGTIGLLKNVAVSTARFVTETASLNQEYLRTSQRLDIAVRTISGLQVAYRDLGLSQEEIEKQLTKLAQKVVESAEGNQSAIDLFKKLKVSVTDAAGEIRPLGDILNDVSDGMVSLKTQQEKIAIGNLLFGETFTKVVDVLGRGSAVMEQSIATAERWGQTINGRDARAADIFATALGNANFQMEGFKRHMATKFTTGLIEELSRGSEGSERFAKTMRDAGIAAEDFGRSMAPAVEGLKTLLELWVRWGEFRDDVLFKYTVEPLGEIAAGIREQITRPWRHGAMYDRFQERQGELEEAARQNAARQERVDALVADSRRLERLSRTME